MPPPLQTYEDELRDRTALHMQVADLTQSQDFRRVYGIPDDIDDADAAWERDAILGRFQGPPRRRRAAAALLRNDKKWRAEHRVCDLRSTSAAQVLGCDHNAPQTLAHYYQRRLQASTRPVESRYIRTIDDARERFEETHPVDCLTIPRLGAGALFHCGSHTTHFWSRGDDGSLDFPAASTLAVLIDVGDMSITRHATATSWPSSEVARLIRTIFVKGWGFVLFSMRLGLVSVAHCMIWLAHETIRRIHVLAMLTTGGK